MNENKVNDLMGNKSVDHGFSVNVSIVFVFFFLLLLKLTKIDCLVLRS